MQFKLLDVKIDSLSKQEILKIVESFIKNNSKHYIVTPNPEFLLAAEKDKQFQNILNRADLAIADGVGIFFAELLFGKIIKRNTGADITIDLLKLAQKHRYRVFIITLKEGLSRLDEIKQSIHKQFPSLLFEVAQISINNLSDQEVVDKIQRYSPDIVFVGLGQVKQEKWIYEHLNKLDSAKVAIGVGGTFDYITGARKRAPNILRHLGLEWLWRALLQQRHIIKHLTQEEQVRFKKYYRRNRLERVFSAVVIFPFKVISYRIKTIFRG